MTAQKRAESVQNVPITITTLTGTQMRDANISVMTQLPLVTTNLQVNFNSDFVAPYIRGIGTSSPTQASIHPLACTSTTSTIRAPTAACFQWPISTTSRS